MAAKGVGSRAVVSMAETVEREEGQEADPRTVRNCVRMDFCTNRTQARHHVRALFRPCERWGLQRGVPKKNRVVAVTAVAPAYRPALEVTVVATAGEKWSGNRGRRRLRHEEERAVAAVSLLYWTAESYQRRESTYKWA